MSDFNDVQEERSIELCVIEIASVSSQLSLPSKSTMEEDKWMRVT
jgi:hypothetical protein